MRVARAVIGFLLFVFGVTLSASAHAQSVEVHLCQQPNEPPAVRAWGEGAAQAINRLSYAGYRQGGSPFRIVSDDSKSCLAQAKNSCFAHGSHVYCNKKQLARLVAAAAASALSHELDGGSVTNTLNVTASFMIADAMLTTDNQIRTSILEQLMGSMGLQMEQILPVMKRMPKVLRWDVEGDQSIIEADPELAMLHPVMEGTVNYVFAYLLGHELAHAYSSCPFSAPSRVEESGLWKTAVSAQSRGKLICANTLLVDEVLADRCALRVVRKLDEAMSAHKKRESQRLFQTFPSPVQMLHSVSRRTAIEAFNHMLMTGFSAGPEGVQVEAPGQDGMYTVAYRSKSTPGYLYQAIRMLLFSQELHESEPYSPDVVAMCDDSAKSFTLAVRATFLGCPRMSDRKLPQLFGPYVPPGVLTGWLSGNWDDSSGGSFACR